MDANQTAIAIQAEPAWGEQPAVPALVKQRFTKSDLKHRKITDTSKEIRDDAQVSDVIELGVDMGGGFDYELHYSTSMMDIIAGAIRGTQTIVDLDLIVCTIDAAANTIAGPQANLDIILVGMWLKVTGAATPANNGIKRVTIKANNAGVTTLTFLGDAFTVNEAGVNLNFDGRFVRNGTTKPPFVVEKQLSTVNFLKYPGSMINTFSLDLVSRAIATGTIGFIGKEGIYAAASIDATGYTVASTSRVMNASHNVGTITEAGVPLVTALKSLRAAITPNLRANDGLGTKGLTSIGAGTVSPTGSVEAYFSTSALLEKFLAHTYSSLSWRVKNADGLFIFEFPYIQFSTGDVDIEGINTDLMQTLEFNAIMHPTDGYTVQVDAIPTPDAI